MRFPGRARPHRRGGPGSTPRAPPSRRSPRLCPDRGDGEGCILEPPGVEPPERPRCLPRRFASTAADRPRAFAGPPGPPPEPVPASSFDVIRPAARPGRRRDRARPRTRRSRSVMLESVPHVKATQKPERCVRPGSGGGCWPPNCPPRQLGAETSATRRSPRAGPCRPRPPSRRHACPAGRLASTSPAGAWTRRATRHARHPRRTPRRVPRPIPCRTTRARQADQPWPDALFTASPGRGGPARPHPADLAGLHASADRRRRPAPPSAVVRTSTSKNAPRPAARGGRRAVRPRQSQTLTRRVMLWP